MSNYSYIDSVLKFKKNYFNLSAFLRIFFKKILFSMLIAFVNLNVAIIIVISFSYLLGYIDGVYDVKNILSRFNPIYLIIILLIAYVLLVTLSFKITLKDRIQLYEHDFFKSKEALAKLENIDIIDLLTIKSKLLQTKIIKSMSKTKGIDKYTLFKLLYEDPSINFEEFFEYVTLKYSYKDLNTYDKCLYFVIALKMNLSVDYREIYDDFFKNRDDLAKFSKIVFEDKAPILLNFLENKLKTPVIQ